MGPVRARSRLGSGLQPHHQTVRQDGIEAGPLEDSPADIADKCSLNKTSWYFNHKQYHKYASLCLLAGDAAIVSKSRKLSLQLETLLAPFLDNTLAPYLIYVTSYCGLVISQSFTANDVNADSVYNDHHYHNGYWVTVSAMLKSLHPKWKRMKELDAMIWMMLRDVANPSSEDAFFPKFHHFSFYLDRSYSHGVTPMADGKDEESTLEDVILPHDVGQRHSPQGVVPNVTGIFFTCLFLAEVH